MENGLCILPLNVIQVSPMTWMTMKSLVRGELVVRDVKRGHFLSDYRQKCVNRTRDILMLKERKMTILAKIMF